MSTKIYEAYKIPVARLGDWQEFFHRACEKYIIKELRGVDHSFLKEEELKGIFEGSLARLEGYNGREIGICYGLGRWMNDSKKGFASVFNYDSSFNCWIYQGWAYIIPYWPCGMKSNVPYWCNDFSYWNNSDPPENISYGEWEEREHVWEKLALNNWDKGRMSHVAFEGKENRGEVVGLMDLIRVVVGNDDEAWDRIYCGSHIFKDWFNVVK